MTAARVRPTLDKPRSRRDAAKVLGIALQARYRRLLEASGDDETVVATADLAQAMYENIEFVIWALKTQGGMHPPPPEILRPISAPTMIAPKFEKLLDLPCNCLPLEHGIIGHDRHMTSCPKYVP